VKLPTNSSLVAQGNYESLRYIQYLPQGIERRQCIPDLQTSYCKMSDSKGEKLDVVTVLLGDKWTTVDSLPAPESGMRSTLRDGNLHFMGGSLQSATAVSYSSRLAT